MNQRMPMSRVILIATAVAVLVPLVPVLLLDFEPPVWITLEALAALSGAGLGWLFTKLG
jgi:hypothetical protein